MLDGDDWAVAQRLRREDAEEIVASHNALDPIKSYTDWLLHKERP